MTKNTFRCAWVAGLLALAAPSAAAAQQYDWESGGGSPPADSSGGTATPPPSSSSSSSSSSASSAPAQMSQGDDHERVVGHLAVGYLGINQVPVGTVATNVTAPAIGVRYWFADLVGLDVGLGLGYSSQMAVTAGGGTANVHDVFGFIVHAGVPIAPAHTDHFVFEITPEANFGIGSGTVQGTGPNPMNTGLNGVMFQLGGRVGTELHFGFIGVPQLSLTASVGLYFMYQQASINPPSPAPVTSNDLTTISTTVMGQPWQIFAGTISAFYYFD
jgi:hypothetical protein